MITICCWHREDEDESKQGWYWDDSEDHGGFDRISPNGPHPTAEAAKRDAQKTFNATVTMIGGQPNHYHPEAEGCDRFKELSELDLTEDPSWYMERIS